MTIGHVWLPLGQTTGGDLITQSVRFTIVGNNARLLEPVPVIDYSVHVADHCSTYVYMS